MIIKGKELKYFTDVVDYARRGIEFLCEYHDSFGYKQFGDRGSSCWKPLKQNQAELTMEDEMIGAVRAAMPHGSALHTKLSKAVAKDLNRTQLQYDWLCKATARILANENEDLDDLKSKAEVQRTIKKIMQQKGLKTIHSLDDLI